MNGEIGLCLLVQDSLVSETILARFDSGVGVMKFRDNPLLKLRRIIASLARRPINIMTVVKECIHGRDP